MSVLTDVLVGGQVLEHVNLCCNRVLYDLVRRHVDDLHCILQPCFTMDALANHTRQTPAHTWGNS